MSAQYQASRSKDKMESCFAMAGELVHLRRAPFWERSERRGKPGMESYFKKLLEHQKRMKKLCGADYDDNDYVCKWDDGRPLEPNNVTRQFRLFLEKSGLPKIRLHDLRHSAASLLQAMASARKKSPSG